MIGSAGKRRAVRESGANPGRSRRCEGRRSRAAVPLASAGKATREGAPSQKTSARRRSEPLAEGGFVFRRPLVLLAALVAMLVLVPAALAAAVHVRVEGKTQTIFGPTQPVVSGSNALEALSAAAVRGEFYYHVQTSSFGPYVDQIGLYPAGGQAGWVFKVNGVSPPVGADQVRKTIPSGTTIHVAGRSVAAPKGRACLKPHRGLVWATAPGAVRSNRLAVHAPRPDPPPPPVS